MRNKTLQAPFPWFGGKRKVAPQVWAALGDVRHYAEPFAGSLAVLLGRPAAHRGHLETVNDKDAYVCNFWRALKADPEGLAALCDWPVNETDLNARHLWLVNEGAQRVKKLGKDPDYYDLKVAGWWVWGICAWIGSGWCAAAETSRGVHKQLPHIGSGMGVHKQLPHIGSGKGVHKKLPHIGPGADRGVHSSGRNDLVPVFERLAERLRRVRVCCGDWKRVLTDGALAHGTSIGVFLDPPYLGEVRNKNLYRKDDHTISHEVREWALEHGDDKRMRIVLAGYTDEHEKHMPENWRRVRWVAGSSYQTAESSKREGNNVNRKKECLWLSPHCKKARAGFFGG